MSHGLRSYWNGCRCFPCRVAYSAYWRAGHLARARGEHGLIPAKRARQLLLKFENSLNASRVVDLNQSTIHRILSKKTKKIRRETERKILRAA